MIQSKRINGTDIKYVIADPMIDDIDIKFKIGSTVKELGQSAAAHVAANFNFADNDTGTPIGRVILDGKAVIGDIEKTTERDELYMMPDGTLHIGKAPVGALWAIQGSPRLLDNGKNVIADSVRRDQTGNDIWTRNAYRLAVGLTAESKLVIARTMHAISLDALAAIMADLGCVDALNGDGGGSAYLYPADNGWGRKMGVALTVIKGEDILKHIGDIKPELIIDPGHGGIDYGGGTDNGIIEKNMTLDISMYQYKRFKELGIRVALTRDSDKTIDSTARANMVKNSGAKHCISNHINAASSTSDSASGIEVIHSKFSNGKLAMLIVEEVSNAGQIKRKTPTFSKTQSDGQDWYFMHRNTGNVETVIAEYGFATNAKDAARLKEKWQEYAEAAVKAYCQYVGHKYTPPVTSQPKPEEKPVEVVAGMTDIAGHWAQTQIVAAIESGVIVGVANDRWAPDQPVTRAQLAVILNRLGLTK